MNNGDHVTINGIVSRKTIFPHDIAHVDLATEHGLIIVETSHAIADNVVLGVGIKVSGAVKIERACRFLVDATISVTEGFEL